MQWLRFGRWPSSHDINLVLDATEDEYERIEQSVWCLSHEHGETVKVTAPPVPECLVAAAIAAADGLLIDAFLSPHPGDFSVAAWSVPPYSVWRIGWRAT